MLACAAITRQLAYTMQHEGHCGGNGGNTAGGLLGPLRMSESSLVTLYGKLEGEIDRHMQCCEWCVREHLSRTRIEM